MFAATAALIFAASHGAYSRAQQAEKQAQPAAAEQLFAMTNATRVQNAGGRLVWDRALADAAMKHCMRMAAEGPIEHRYPGEPDLSARAGMAGAHFSLIEENIALGFNPAAIHQGWLNSPGHRSNMLNPEIDRVGIAVVFARGSLYAVADYARGVPVLSPAEVEGTVASLLIARGVTVRRDAAEARAACRLDRGLTNTPGAEAPQFVMRWQDADLSRLPVELTRHLSSGRYRQAAVGSCPAQNSEGTFTVYRVAVLLY